LNVSTFAVPFVDGELEKGSQLPLEIKIASRE
ncbi:hypothetical protein MPER_08167, partial [Moniliophthora perniciosa FA553]